MCNVPQRRLSLTQRSRTLPALLHGTGVCLANAPALRGFLAYPALRLCRALFDDGSFFPIRRAVSSMAIRFRVCCLSALSGVFPAAGQFPCAAQQRLHGALDAMLGEGSAALGAALDLPAAVVLRLLLLRFRPRLSAQPLHAFPRGAPCQLPWRGGGSGRRRFPALLLDLPAHAARASSENSSLNLVDIRW